jgi:hypothetical protein
VLREVRISRLTSQLSHPIVAAYLPPCHLLWRVGLGGSAAVTVRCLLRSLGATEVELSYSSSDSRGGRDRGGNPARDPVGGDSPLHGGNRVDSASSVSSPTHPRPFQPRAPNTPPASRPNRATFILTSRSQIGISTMPRSGAWTTPKPSRSRSTSHTSQMVARTRTWNCSSPLGSSACSPLYLSSLCSNRLSCLV